MYSRKDKVKLWVCGIGVFLIMAIFFCQIHPLVIFDTDDWAYIYSARRALPIWKGWNPAKIFPEEVMPMISQLGVSLFYPFSKDYIGALALAHGLFVALCITIFIMEMVWLLKEKYYVDSDTSVLLGILFLVFHFLIFRKFYSGNQHLFYSSNVTCYYNYTLPIILNCILVMHCMRRNVAENWWKKEKLLQKGILVVSVYLAIFSNLFASVIFCAYVGVNLVLDLIINCKNRTFSLKKYVSENSLRLIVFIGWVIAQIFELSGGRANDIGNSNILIGLKSAIIILFNYIYKINYSFVFVVGAVLVGLVILLFKDKKSLSGMIGKEIGKALFGMALSIIYLLLLCAKASPGYIGRCDVIIGVFFWGFLIVLQAVCMIWKRLPHITLIMPLTIFILIFEINTSGVTFLEPNMGGLAYEKCVEIDNDIIEQMVAADAAGEGQVQVYIPDFGTSDNWPIALYGGERISDALAKHGIISQGIYTELVPTKEKNEQFHIE